MPTLLELEKQFDERLANQKSSEQIREEEAQRVGLPARREALNNITRSILDTSKVLKNVEADVASRGRQLGGPVTEAARRRLTTATAAPIESRLIDFGDQKAREEVGISDLEKEVAQMLGLRIQDQITGNDLFLEKIKRQMDREQEEWERAYAEKQFALQQQQAAADEAYRKRLLELQNRPRLTIEDIRKLIDTNKNELVINTKDTPITTLVSNAGVNPKLAKAGDAIYAFRDNPSAKTYFDVVKNAPRIGYEGIKGILDSIF